MSTIYMYLRFVVPVNNLMIFSQVVDEDHMQYFEVEECYLAMIVGVGRFQATLPTLRVIRL
jgi:hypothetical protein